MTAADRKKYWDLVETLQWIVTRDEGGITAIGDMNEKKWTLPAIFTAEAVPGAHELWVLAKNDFRDDSEPAAWQADRKSLNVNKADIVAPGQALNYLLQQMRSRRIRMTAIKCDRYRTKQVPVPPAELGGLEFRITSDHRLAKVGLWSPSHNTLIWRSPQFLRSDVIRVWPPRKKKSARFSPNLTTPADGHDSSRAKSRRAAAVPRQGA